MSNVKMRFNEIIDSALAIDYKPYQRYLWNRELLMTDVIIIMISNYGSNRFFFYTNRNEWRITNKNKIKYLTVDIIVFTRL